MRKLLSSPLLKTYHAPVAGYHRRLVLAPEALNGLQFVAEVGAALHVAQHSLASTPLL
jgi:hypothetical protein